MKTFQTIEAAANLKGMAKYTYNRVMSAMAEDTTAAMLHTFAALTDGAKAIALQSGKFSNLYIRGERKGMAAEEAAKELTERAAGCVTRKHRKIDMICAVAFLAEYISRQRKAIETPEPDNTPTTMNANETSANGLIDFTQFGNEVVLHPESSRDYPAAPYYVTNENKFLSNWRKEIDGRASKDIYLCESWEEAKRVYDYLRNERNGREYANKYTNISSSRPRLNTTRNIYSVRYNDGGNKAYQA